MSQYRDRLMDALATNAVVTVVGTGVSVAATKQAPSADWVGLLRSGLGRFSNVDPAAKKWMEFQLKGLDIALETSDTQMLIGVASQLVAKLTVDGRQPYVDWLRETVGALKVRDRTLIDSLGSLRTPLLTTNYDNLLEDVLKRGTVTWRDREGMREVFRSNSEDIGHLHGHWKTIDSIVLTESDYTSILKDDPAQTLEVAHYTSKSFLFVGYGDGLSDPNFDNLLRWHRKLFPESRNDHFRLCRERDFDQLSVYHGRDDIRVISYGKEFEDLPKFLRGLRGPSENKRKHGGLLDRDAVAYAREAIVQQIRAETVVGDSVEDIDERDLSDITVKPVLLPMPHEQFANARALETSVRPERVNPDTVHIGRKILIVAGEELSGVTTALRWIVSNAALNRQRTAPIFVDARNCSSTHRPLDRQIRREALRHGLITGRKDSLGAFALAVDNVKPHTNDEYHNLISDVLAAEIDFMVIGCREGDEGQLVEDLRESAIPVEIVYLGKLGIGEVQEFARILAPTRPAIICDNVMRVVQSERLPRTPFTIALLIVLLSQGASGNMINNSETSVLEKYTSLLLGRSGPFLDPRRDLDPLNREVVLSELAKRFVRQRRGAVTESEAISYISTYFISRDWSESATATLETFRRMRLLRVENNTVQFQQTSYLHLFAAKAATRDSSFLNEMLRDPLYFAPIIRHFAALERNSELVVGEMHKLLAGWTLTEPSGSFFGPVRTREVAEVPEGADIAPDADVSQDARPDDADGEAAADQSDSLENADGAAGRFDADDYDDSSDADRVPFPLDDPAQWPNQTRLLTALELSSRVLRDSDDLANLQAKSDLFALVVERWGFLAELLEGDHTFDDLAEELTDSFMKEGFLRGIDRDEFAEFFALSMTGFTLYRALLATLASRKLIKTYERVRDTEGVQADPYSAIMLALFSFSVRTPGWTKDLLALARTHGSRWSTSQFMTMVVRVTWEYDMLSESDAADVREFIKMSIQNRFVFPNERTRKIRLKEYEQKLLRQRAAGQAERANRLGKGPSRKQLPR